MSLSEDVINCIGNYMEWPLDAVFVVVDLRSEEIKIYKDIFSTLYQKPLQEGKAEKPILEENKSLQWLSDSKNQEQPYSISIMTRTNQIVKLLMNYRIQTGNT